MSQSFFRHPPEDLVKEKLFVESLLYWFLRNIDGHSLPAVNTEKGWKCLWIHLLANFWLNSEIKELFSSLNVTASREYILLPRAESWPTLIARLRSCKLFWVNSLHCALSLPQGGRQANVQNLEMRWLQKWPRNIKKFPGIKNSQTTFITQMKMQKFFSPFLLHNHRHHHQRSLGYKVFSTKGSNFEGLLLQTSPLGKIFFLGKLEFAWIINTEKWIYVLKQ